MSEKLQEPKYAFVAGGIMNRASGEMIPHDEPVFIFRARDRQASRTLRYYATTIGRSPDDHWEAVMARVEDFERFAREHPERMKEPDTDLAARAEARLAVDREAVARWFAARRAADTDQGDPKVMPWDRDDADAILALLSPATSPGEGSSSANRAARIASDHAASETLRKLEFGWLIEEWDSRRDALKARWWTLDGENGEWTVDSTRALRFSRKADAQAYIDDIGWTEAKATGHVWYSSPSGDPAGEALNAGLSVFDDPTFGMPCQPPTPDDAGGGG